MGKFALIHWIKNILIIVVATSFLVYINSIRPSWIGDANIATNKMYDVITWVGILVLIVYTICRIISFIVSSLRMTDIKSDYCPLKAFCYTRMNYVVGKLGCRVTHRYIDENMEDEFEYKHLHVLMDEVGVKKYKVIAENVNKNKKIYAVIDLSNRKEVPIIINNLEIDVEFTSGNIELIYSSESKRASLLNIR